MIPYILVGVVLGAIIGLIIGKLISGTKNKNELNELQMRYNELDKQFTGFKASAESSLTNEKEKHQGKIEQIDLISREKEELEKINRSLDSAKSTLAANLDAATNNLGEKNKEIHSLKEQINQITKERDENKNQLATALANNRALTEKQETQKKEIEELNKKFTTEFENIANKILETKTEKFTRLNEENMKTILEPLGKNIDEFKKQVNDVYVNESKDRSSLAERVKGLIELNNQLSKDAQSLTKALKGEAKKQGRWGEVILENILERSGLRKGEEFFMEYQLFDENGKPLRSESQNKKMRPDALIKYPDNRHVIIDAKVSLNAFIRFTESDDPDIQKTELASHVAAVKEHVNELYRRAYDDYSKTLDFVMMFIPNEPAYSAAIQGDADLWYYAYDKRILLMSPTNLIASLKMVADLWSREYQNQNALAIAERGGKLYDKFVLFVQDLKGIGTAIESADKNYKSAYNKLTEGNDNLVLQTTKLKDLGAKAKKALPNDVLNTLKKGDEDEANEEAAEQSDDNA